MRILFIGNSFTNRNDLPGMLAHLAAAGHPARTIESDRVIANGRALKTHWERGDALQSLRAHRWDFVVLQEQSTLPLKNRQRMHEFIRLFDREITHHGSRTVLYMTWARQAEFQRQDELADAYLTIGRELNAAVVPAGLAWQRVLTKHPDIPLHDKDGSHPNPAGTYLAACTFYATLFQQDPAGLPVLVKGLEKAEAKVLQRTAWEAARPVTTRPRRNID